MLVIDEINRGNLPKLLGELLYALEYRGEPVLVPFRSAPLVLPPNLYIIATMNSSDRSIGHIDVATRRRFALHHMAPDSEVVRRLWADHGAAKLGAELAALMDRLNQRLQDAGRHDDLGVGQSYFLPYAWEPNPEQSLLLRVNHSLLPLLSEYDEMLGTGEELGLTRSPFASLDELRTGWS